MNAIFRYPGSKWRIAEWIISFFPEHHSYLEPFAGSLAVLLNKPRSNIETVNDLDGDVVNLFAWIKNDPERLAHEIYYTPYARAVYDAAFETEPKDTLQQAVNFYIKLNMSHGYRTTGERMGWKNDIKGRERAYNAKEWCEIPERIMQTAERLRGVQIENRPAVELIKRFNDKKVLIYADPPYVLSTRNRKQYKEELEDEGQEELVDALILHEGPVILSGYESDLYNDRLKGWHKEKIENYTQAMKKKTEILYMNFKPTRQISMFF